MKYKQLSIWTFLLKTAMPACFSQLIYLFHKFVHSDKVKLGIYFELTNIFCALKYIICF